MPELLRIGSLFSGYRDGGLDLAVEHVTGGRTVWVSDVDPGACAILAHRFPGVPNLGDIMAVDWASVEPVDVICGGSPCQDLSHAGKRAGMTDGTRSNLWVAMREAIAVLRPRLVVWENVRGAYSASADSGLEHCPGCMGSPGDGGPALRSLGRVLGDLSDLGYDAVWVGLRAADVGACHGRFRVFVVAADADEQRHERGRLAWNGRAGLTDGHRGTLALLPTPSAGAFNDAEDLDQWEARRQRVAQTAHNGNGFGTPLGVAVRLMPTPTTEPTSDRWGDYAAAIARHEHLYGPAPDPTEPTGKGGAHRLSPRFTEWMMCLPPGWVTDPAIWHGWTPSKARNAQLKALGNGVVPPQALAALQHMAARHGALAA